MWLQFYSRERGRGEQDLANLQMKEVITILERTYDELQTGAIFRAELVLDNGTCWILVPRI